MNENETLQPTGVETATILSAIDIGTNSAHLVVAQMTAAQGLKILDTNKIVLRLGAAFDSSKNLRQEAINRTIAAVRHLRDVASAYGPTIRCVATHAVREAKNHHDLIEQVQDATGIVIEIIDGIEEARLIALGMNYGFGIGTERFLGVDIGGGSSELIISKEDSVDFVASIKVGAVTLSNKFRGKDGPSDVEVADLNEYISTRLGPLQDDFRNIRFQRALMSSGTAKAIAEIDSFSKSGRAGEDLNGYVVSAASIEEIDKKIRLLRSPKKIKQELAVEADRAEIILAGSAILHAVTRIFSIKEWTYSSYALREGLVIDTYRRMSAAGSEVEENVRTQSVKRLGRRFQIDSNQAQRVTALALLFYDQLSKFSERKVSLTQQLTDRELLKYASWLHECGKFICFTRYHKHGFYLISHSKMLGFTQEEREFIGHISRFHRKGLASSSRRECQGLPFHQICRINFLAGILRIASTLCRTRQSIIEEAEVCLEGDHLIFKLTHAFGTTPDAEIHELDRDKKAIEKSFMHIVDFQLRASSEK
jgi:exopolyphosphatase/guanosine-5'-triphosphate,3'-diphosphate pyrophosphatase